MLGRIRRSASFGRPGSSSSDRAPRIDRSASLLSTHELDLLQGPTPAPGRRECQGRVLGVARGHPREHGRLSLEPGATLRSVDVVDHSGHQTDLGGFVLGVSLSVLSAPWLEPAAAPSTTTTQKSPAGGSG